MRTHIFNMCACIYICVRATPPYFLFDRIRRSTHILGKTPYIMEKSQKPLDSFADEINITNQWR